LWVEKLTGLAIGKAIADELLDGCGSGCNPNQGPPNFTTALPSTD
jgi:hypothetical protein